MRRVLIWLGTAALVAALSGGCDDEETGPGADVSQDMADDAVADAPADTAPDTAMDPTTEPVTPPSECWPTLTGVDLMFEAQGESTEWADCITGCNHDLPLQVYDLATFDEDGLRGRIDDRAHVYDVTDEGPDIDVIGFQAAPRTMVEFLVSPASEEMRIHPTIQTRQGFMGTLTFSAGVVEGFRGARTVNASPFVGNLPFYLAVEDLTNYEALSGAQAGSADYVGGTEYDYVIRVRTSAFAPTELGTLDAENPTATHDAEFACGGDIHYYRFEAQSGITPTVVFERTGSGDLVGVLAGMKTTGGQLSWEAIVADGLDGALDGTVTLAGDAFEDGGTGEFIFAVTDFNGLAGPGDFTYSVTVNLP